MATPLPTPAATASLPDAELLRTWVRHRDEDAFRALAQRHLNFVVATACRCTGQTTLAEEATQLVLTILARKAASLERVPLSPWLHRTTVLECRALLRRESRHRRRVNALASEPQPEPGPAAGDAWQDALPLLDEVIDRLGDEDRRVLVLRFFENMSFREIAVRIGKSEAAVQRQGHRALERLGSLLRRRGVVLPAAGLAAGLSAAHASIPSASSAAKLIANLFTASSPQPAGAALLLNSLHTMSQTKLAITTAAVVTVLAAVPIGLQYRENDRLARALETAESKITTLTAVVSTGASATSNTTAAASLTSPVSSADKTRRITAGRKNGEETKPAEKKTNPLAGLSEYLNNPAMKKVLESQLAGQIEMMYGPFIDSLSLTPDERKHLMSIMTGWMSASTQDALKAMGGTPEERQKLDESVKARTVEQQARIREFLNDDGDYQRYQAWEARIQEHQTMTNVRSELEKRGLALDQKKEDALIELMYKERKASPYTNDFTNPHQELSGERPVFNGETVDAHVSEMQALQERVAVAAVADGLLTKEQAEVFRAANRSHAETTRTALKMAASVMGGLQNSGGAEAK